MQCEPLRGFYDHLGLVPFHMWQYLQPTLVRTDAITDGQSAMGKTVNLAETVQLVTTHSLIFLKSIFLSHRRGITSTIEIQKSYLL